MSLPASLEQLVLSQTNIADESLDTLPASIKKLDLSFTSITNRALLHLPPNLEVRVCRVVCRVSCLC